MKVNDNVYLVSDIVYNDIELKAGLRFKVKEIPCSKTIKVTNNSVGDILLELDDVTPFKSSVKFSKEWWGHSLVILIFIFIFIALILYFC